MGRISPARPRLITQMAILLAATAAGAFTMRALEEAPLAWTYPWSKHVENSVREKGMRLVELDEAHAIVTTFSHVLIDARKTADYNAGRIPGALSLPLLEFDAAFPGIAPLLTPEQPIVVYCSGEDCDESIKLGDLLIKGGYTNVSLFAGGMIAWKAAGYEVER